MVSIFSPSKIRSSFKNPLNFSDILNYARVLFLNERSYTRLRVQHISIHARMAEGVNKAHYSSLAHHFFDKITWIESFQNGEKSAVYYCTQLCARFAIHHLKHCSPSLLLFRKDHSLLSCICHHSFIYSW